MESELVKTSNIIKGQSKVKVPANTAQRQQYKH